MWKQLTVVIVLLAISLRYWWYSSLGQERTAEQLNVQYDYIIGVCCVVFNNMSLVGAGSAGCVLANRLSVNASVLLIEAGPHEYSVPFTHIPGLVPLLQQSHIDWMHKTVPQTHSSLGLHDQVHYSPVVTHNL